MSEDKLARGKNGKNSGKFGKFGEMLGDKVSKNGWA